MTELKYQGTEEMNWMFWAGMSVLGRRNYMCKGPGAGGAYQVGELEKGHCSQNREVAGEHSIR